MAEVLPALLDRLRDDAPDKKTEALSARVMSMREFRNSVLDHMERLLNSGNLGTAQPLDRYPLVARSVVNYGLPNLAGQAVAPMTPTELEKIVRDALLTFEPRIQPATLRVRAVVSPDRMSRKTVSFEIEGELWAHPVPLRLLIRTEVDLETGHVSVGSVDRGGRDA